MKASVDPQLTRLETFRKRRSLLFDQLFRIQ
jgi:hypothetical protein